MIAPAIGGTFAAEPERPARADSLWRRWTEGRAHHAAFRCGRSALAALLAHRRIARLWLPTYVCQAVVEGAGGVEIGWYGVSAGLEPELDPLEDGLRAGDAVLAVDYFGRAPCPAFRALAARRRDVLWIEDRAQAMAPDAPAWGDVVLYSPRKLLGVADGGLLVSDDALPSPGVAAPDSADLWAPEDARAADPSGAHPETWRPMFLAREARFTTSDAPMSGRSRTALAGVDAGSIIAARQANWRRLAHRLADIALWPIADPAFAPLAFPILTDDAARLSRGLAEQRLWCPRHWADLPAGAADDAVARSLSSRLLSLPCDQRYGAEEMERLAGAVLALI